MSIPGQINQAVLYSAEIEKPHSIRPLRCDDDGVLQISGIHESISLGTAPGSTVLRYSFGRNTNVDNAMVDLWEGPTTVYVFPTTSQQMRVVSSSAADAAAGTGVRQAHIHYLDSNYVEQHETVTLNGTTPVNTVATDILRVNGLHSWTVGSGGVPAGNVSLQNTAGTVTYGYMAAGLNVALQSNFTVPAGHDFFITHWKGSSGSTAGLHFTQILIRATSHYGVLIPGVFLVHDMIGTQDGGESINTPISIRIPAMADVKVSAISDSATANVTAMGMVSGFIKAQL